MPVGSGNCLPSGEVTSAAMQIIIIVIIIIISFSQSIISHHDLSVITAVVQNCLALKNKIYLWPVITLAKLSFKPERSSACSSLLRSRITGYAVASGGHGRNLPH